MVPTNILLQLKDEESVFINNLGLFTKEFISAKVVKGKVNPPKYKVNFDSTAKGNGFGFTLKLSKHENIRITEADEAIKTWVANIQDALTKKGSFKEPDFGTFTLKEDVINFKCGTLPLLNSEFDGMEEVELPTVTSKKREEVAEKKTEPTNSIEVIASPKPEEPVKPIASTTPIIKTDPTIIATPVQEHTQEIITSDNRANHDADDDSSSKKRSNSGFIITVILLIIIIGLLIIAYFKKQTIVDACCNILAQKIEQVGLQRDSQENSVLVPLDTTSNVDTETPAEATATQQITVEKTPEVKTAPAKPQATPAPKATTNRANVVVINPVSVITQLEAGMFYLISGSFSDEKAAQEHIIKAHFEKYHPSIIHLPNTNYRICLGFFENEEDALSYKQMMKIDAWVLKN